MDDIKQILSKGTSIFNPQAKVIANADRVVEFLETGNTKPVFVEVDPSNACNHGCYFCISSYIHLPESFLSRSFSDFQRRNNKALEITETLLNAITPPAITGFNNPRAATGKVTIL